jgi:hypothetical protein
VKVTAKKASPPATRTQVNASAMVSTPRRQPASLGAPRDLAALVERVVAIIEDARDRIVRTVNSEMVLSYWHIGRELVEYVQRGEARAEYGKEVIEGLSRQLLTRVGKGYSPRNLWYFRDFYVTYRDRTPKVRAEGFRTSLVQNSKPADATRILHEAGAELAEGFSSRLSWTHYRALLAVSDPAARAFYEIEAERENWSTAHLERQIFTSLHLRLLKSRKKAGVMELAGFEGREGALSGYGSTPNDVSTVRASSSACFFCAGSFVSFACSELVASSMAVTRNRSAASVFASSDTCRHPPMEPSASLMAFIIRFTSASA